MRRRLPGRFLTSFGMTRAVLSPLTSNFSLLTSHFSPDLAASTSIIMLGGHAKELTAMS
jgi:hypothetical protein